MLHKQNSCNFTGNLKTNKITVNHILEHIFWSDWNELMQSQSHNLRF